MHRVTSPCKIFRARTGSKKSHYIEGEAGVLANNLPKAQRECGAEAGTDPSILESVQLPKTLLSSADSPSAVLLCPVSEPRNPLCHGIQAFFSSLKSMEAFQLHF